jgi:hypothetical protein
MAGGNRRVVRGLAVGLPAAAVLLLLVSGGAQGGGTVWDGVFSATQVERGAELYADRC